MSAARLTPEERAAVAWRAVCAKHSDAARLFTLRRNHPKQFRANPVARIRLALIQDDLRQLLDKGDAALLRVERARARGKRTLSEQIERSAERAEGERRSDEQRKRRNKRPGGDALTREIIEVLHDRRNISAKDVGKLLSMRAGPANTIRRLTAEKIVWIRADGTLQTTLVSRLASRVSRIKKVLSDSR